MIQLNIVVKNDHEVKCITAKLYAQRQSFVRIPKQLEGWFVWYCCALV